MDEINGMNTESAFNDEFAALEAEYGFNTEEFDNTAELTQNLEGFASCFPEWDLHPPIDY